MPVNLLAVDLDPDAEYLTFNLAFMTCLVNMKRDTELIRPQDVRWVELNRVTPYWDENGNVNGLRADRLPGLREEHLCYCDSITLRGYYVAYSLRSFEMSTLHDGKTIDWTSRFQM